MNIEPIHVQPHHIEQKGCLAHVPVPRYNHQVAWIKAHQLLNTQWPVEVNASTSLNIAEVHLR